MRVRGQQLVAQIADRHCVACRGVAERGDGRARSQRVLCGPRTPKAAEQAVESQWDERRREAERLRVAAAEASAEVAGLRQQIAAAEQVEREIAATEAEARAHAVGVDVLSAYRDAQTQRAWRALEQTAGALLAEATEGRYADVRLSGNDFRLVIVDRGEEHPFDRYSGGEQDHLCVRLAIADWIARERDVELGFVVLDEVFGSQDDDRRRGLIDQLRRLSERFHQMLVISHVAEIADQCDTVIALEQPERGRSRIAA
jgi:exonuclease SbcC